MRAAAWTLASIAAVAVLALAFWFVWIAKP